MTRDEAMLCLKQRVLYRYDKHSDWELFFITGVAPNGMFAGYFSGAPWTDVWASPAQFAPLSVEYMLESQ